MSIYEKSVTGNTVVFSEVTATEVVANPEDTATEQLEKLKVGDTVYQAGISAEDSSKLSRALVTPAVAPTDTELVAVNSSNAQAMLRLGDSLVVENGVLNAVTGGGLYCYRAIITFTSVDTDERFRYTGTIYTATELVEGILPRLNKTEVALLKFFTRQFITAEYNEEGSLLFTTTGGFYTSSNYEVQNPNVYCGYLADYGFNVMQIRTTVTVYVERVEL